MIRAMYTAVSGMLTEHQRLDLMANNLANTQTPGFKAADLARTSQPATRGAFATDLQTATAVPFVSSATGALRPTGAPYDFALEGAGYFTVETPGGPAYTRNGHFRRQGDGRLTDGSGNAVLGEKGPIRLPPTSDVQAAEDGTLTAGGKPVGRLKIVDFPDSRALRPTGRSLLYPMQGAQPIPSEARVVAESLEDSNVSSMEEMSRMVELLRAYESYQKTIQTVMDEVTGEAVRRIGRLA